jgi:transposase InsO family protein
MALTKDGLWGIVNGTEDDPGGVGDAHKKYMSRRDRALAIVVLSIDPSLLYLIGDPKDPTVVWKLLSDQFQKKTWANKLELRRKLYSLRLKEGASVQEHIKEITELFEGLAVIGDAVSEEDRVVYLLASLPESYNMLVTALEASSDTVPKMATVTERLLHEERKMNEKATGDDDKKALAAKHSYKRGNPRRQVICHYCKKSGHIKRECRKLAAANQRQATSEEASKPKHSARNAAAKERASSDDEAIMVVNHALAATHSSENWIVDSGATCHMCNDKKMFRELRNLSEPQDISLGDGHVLEAIAKGFIDLEMLLPDGSSQKCTLKDVLYVPKLSHNLLSVSKASESGKTTKFNNSGCEIFNRDNKVIAFGTRVGSLYYLEFCRSQQQVHMVEEESKERLWHRRYGHLGEKGLRKLAKERLVQQFDYNATNDIGFCEACVGGKHQRGRFETSNTQTKEILELVHSDVCGKMRQTSIGGAEYFLTFTDDKSRYSWVYPLKTKDQVFDRFLEWKALVEKSSGKRLKTLRSDNGGEYTSKRFNDYLKAEGIRHEFTIPKTPEQNGVAERLNRTLVESARSMLLDAKLSHKFWAEAVSTAVYLRNRCPTKAVNGMTPHEAWYGYKPKVRHLRVFGCDAYAHIPRDERGKFDSKSRKCILLGYGKQTKGYRLFDPIQRKVLHSRDVQFNENEKKSEEVYNDQNHQLIVDLSEPQPQTESQTPEESAPEQDVRRSTRERRQPSYYGMEHSHLSVQKEPVSIEEATTSPESSKWTQAMEAEMKSLKDNDVWELVKLPAGKKAVGSKWVYKVKTGPDGTPERYKARLVAQGFTQKFGSDYDETFCPVVRQESLRVLTALSIQCGLKLHQVDVTTAFLNGNLEEEVYMAQPKGFIKQGEENLVCKLKKSIYGLKQSPRCWNAALDTQLRDMGFTQSTSDPCIYYRNAGGDMFCLGVYVDDIILAGSSDDRIKEVKDTLSQKFEIKDMGKLHHFLGISVVQDENRKTVWIGQPAYIENLLRKFEMEHCKPVSTPVNAGSKLEIAKEEEECVEQPQYQSAIGSLMYLSVSTRPDIAYAVGTLARFSSKPTKEHWTALKRVLRYLKGTTKHGILYSQKNSGECVGYSDADWAGDINDRKSTSGYVFQIGGAPVTWRSKKQACVALSTAEAEYIALSSAAQESIWLRRLTSELGSPPETATTIYEDNQSAIAMTKNPQFHGRAKHIDIKYHFIREHVNSGNITLKYCPTDEMTADILTKPLSTEQFCKLRKKAGIVEEPSSN